MGTFRIRLMNKIPRFGEMIPYLPLILSWHKKDPDTTVSTPPAIVQLVNYVPLPKMLSAVDRSRIY